MEAMNKKICEVKLVKGKARKVSMNTYRTYYRGLKLLVEGASEFEAKRRARILFAARTGNTVGSWEIAAVLN